MANPMSKSLLNRVSEVRVLPGAWRCRRYNGPRDIASRVSQSTSARLDELRAALFQQEDAPRGLANPHTERGRAPRARRAGARTPARRSRGPSAGRDRIRRAHRPLGHCRDATGRERGPRLHRVGDYDAAEPQLATEHALDDRARLGRDARRSRERDSARARPSPTGTPARMAALNGGKPSRPRAADARGGSSPESGRCSRSPRRDRGNAWPSTRCRPRASRRRPPPSRGSRARGHVRTSGTRERGVAHAGNVAHRREAHRDPRGVQRRLPPSSRRGRPCPSSPAPARTRPAAPSARCGCRRLPGPRQRTAARPAHAMRP